MFLSDLDNNRVRAAPYVHFSVLCLQFSIDKKARGHDRSRATWQANKSQRTDIQSDAPAITADTREFNIRRHIIVWCFLYSAT